MKLMDDYINDDIQFDDSPRRKASKDFDDSSSEGSSNGGGGGGASMPMDNDDNLKYHKQALPRRSNILKKSIDSVINGLKVFGQKPKNKSNVDLINNNNNLNLEISETNSEISEAELNEENIAFISEEQSKIIDKQLTNDPNLVTKMFDELTKTFDEEDKKSTKSNSSKGSRKSVKKEETITPLVPVSDETVNVVEETELEDSSDTKLNNTEPINANKKKRKGKKK
jgi:hypothetical protein